MSRFPLAPAPGRTIAPTSRPHRAPAIAAPAYRIRLATVDDIPGIAAMIPVSTRALSAGHYSERQIESALAHIIGVDSQLIADGTYYVAVDGNRIVGAGGWSRRANIYGTDRSRPVPPDLLDPATSAARIRAMFVHPAWARQGIGRRIVQRSEAEARRAGFRRMELAATIPGEPLYAALGYAVSERTSVTLPDGEAIAVALMAKALDDPEP